MQLCVSSHDLSELLHILQYKLRGLQQFEAKHALIPYQAAAFSLQYILELELRSVCCPILLLLPFSSSLPAHQAQEAL